MLRREPMLHLICKCVYNITYSNTGVEYFRTQWRKEEIDLDNMNSKCTPYTSPKKSYSHKCMDILNLIIRCNNYYIFIIVCIIIWALILGFVVIIYFFPIPKRHLEISKLLYEDTNFFVNPKLIWNMHANYVWCSYNGVI
jgi:hypothetical protein